jgi:hypothetical protein
MLSFHHFFTARKVENTFHLICLSIMHLLKILKREFVSDDTVTGSERQPSPPLSSPPLSSVAVTFCSWKSFALLRDSPDRPAPAFTARAWGGEGRVEWVMAMQQGNIVRGRGRGEGKRVRERDSVCVPAGRSSPQCRGAVHVRCPRSSPSPPHCSRNK